MRFENNQYQVEFIIISVRNWQKYRTHYWSYQFYWLTFEYFAKNEKN